MADDDEVPKIGKGPWGGFKLPMRHLISVAMLIIALIAVLTLRKGCSQSVGNFFQLFDVDAGPAVTPPPPLPPPPPPTTPPR
jgi:hypothetical protein